jgi:hypothetical protein
MIERTFDIFLIVNRSGQPYPCTVASTVERTKELAETAFIATWPTLEREGWQIARGQLVVGQPALPPEHSAIADLAERSELEQYGI